MCVFVLGPIASVPRFWRGAGQNESGHHRGLSTVLSAEDGLRVSKGLSEKRRDRWRR